MSEFDDQIDVTPGPGPATYNVFSGFSKDTLAFTADGLLNLGHWILTHRQELINAPSNNAADPERDTGPHPEVITGDVEREEMLRQLQHEANERSITRSHFDSDAAYEQWSVDHPQ